MTKKRKRVQLAIALCNRRKVSDPRTTRHQARKRSKPKLTKGRRRTERQPRSKDSMRLVKN